jgi:hypothetical protein
MLIAFWWESQKERDVNWENYIKINDKEIESGGVDWIYMAHDRGQ